MRRVLVIEDQAEIRRLIRWSLEFEDYEVREAADAVAGLALALEFRPELVLLDVMMPGPIDGLEACRRLKTDAALGAPKVVMLSARAQQADLAAGTGAGADRYMTKPFSPQLLLDAVASLLPPPPAGGA